MVYRKLSAYEGDSEIIKVPLKVLKRITAELELESKIALDIKKREIIEEIENEVEKRERSQQE